MRCTGCLGDASGHPAFQIPSSTRRAFAKQQFDLIRGSSRLVSQRGTHGRLRRPALARRVQDLRACDSAVNQEGTGCATSGEGIGVGLICRDRPDQEPARDRAVITSCSLQPQAERVRRMSFAQRSSEIGWSTMLSGVAEKPKPRVLYRIRPGAYSWSF